MQSTGGPDASLPRHGLIFALGMLLSKRHIVKVNKARVGACLLYLKRDASEACGMTQNSRLHDLGKETRHCRISGRVCTDMADVHVS